MLFFYAYIGACLLAVVALLVIGVVSLQKKDSIIAISLLMVGAACVGISADDFGPHLDRCLSGAGCMILSIVSLWWAPRS